MSNKKGGAFAIGMVIIVIFLIGFTWHGFVLANRKIDGGVSSLENLSNIYEVSDRLSLYLKEAAKFSAHQSFYTLVQEAAIDKDRPCFTRSYQNINVVIWSEQCKPEQDFIEQKFFLEYDKSLSIFLNNYPEKNNVTTSYTLENNTITTIVKTTLTTEQSTAYAIYNLSYDLNRNFVLNLTDEQIWLDDFPKIYEKASSKIKECKGKTNIEKCLEEMRFEQWDFDAIPFGTWIFFEFSTKKPFFFEDETGQEQFKKIILKFGLMT